MLGRTKVKAVHRTVADSRCLLCATYGQKNDAIYGQRVSEEWCGQKKGCFYGHLRERQINWDFPLSLKVDQKCAEGRFCNCREYQIWQFNCRMYQNSYTYSDTKLSQKQQKTATEALLLRFCCGATGNRPRDTRIFSPLLYQLSYGTKLCLELPYLSIGIAKVDIIF